MVHKTIDRVQWGLIIILGIGMLFLGMRNKNIISDFEAYKKDGTYVKTYQSQTIRELEKSKSALSDSLKKIKNVKQAVIIKYRYVYNTDTVYVDRLLQNPETKVYTFQNKNDSLNYNLKIKATEIDWYKLDIKLNDNIMLINKESNGQNQITGKPSSSGGSIESIEAFNKKEPNPNAFFKRFSYGMQIGLGYGLITKQPDVYVGVGLNFRLNNLKAD